MNYYFDMWKYLFDFGGLASRKEFWFALLYHILIYVLLFVLLFISEIAFYISIGSYFIISFIPRMSLFVRRLHDTDRTGLTYLWILFPIIGYVILLIFCVEKTRFIPNETIIVQDKKLIKNTLGEGQELPTFNNDDKEEKKKAKKAKKTKITNKENLIKTKLELSENVISENEKKEVNNESSNNYNKTDTSTVNDIKNNQ